MSAGNKQKYDKERVSNLIKNHLDKIDKIVLFYLNLIAKLEENINYPQEFFDILARVEFTFAQKVQLR